MEAARSPFPIVFPARRTPNDWYCSVQAEPKVQNVREKFGERSDIFSFKLDLFSSPIRLEKPKQ
jgi:hypothetical protein